MPSARYLWLLQPSFISAPKLRRSLVLVAQMTLSSFVPVARLRPSASPITFSVSSMRRRPCLSTSESA